MALPERPPAERIQDILDHRFANFEHLHMRYEARRDYLQLCAEIEHLRAEIEGLKSKGEPSFYTELAGEIRRYFSASHLTSPEAVLAAVEGHPFEVYFDPAYPVQRAGILAA